MYQLLLVIHVLVAAAVIGLVLIQHGKGADIGGSFGAGASNTIFGSQGTGGVLFKLTVCLALTFFVTSLLLSSIVANQYHKANQQNLPQQSRTAESNIPLPVENDKKERV